MKYVRMSFCLLYPFLCQWGGWRRRKDNARRYDRREKVCKDDTVRVRYAGDGVLLNRHCLRLLRKRCAVITEVPVTPVTLLAGVLLMTSISSVATLALYVLCRIAFVVGDAISEWRFWRRVRNGDIPAPYRAFYGYEK